MQCGEVYLTGLHEIQAAEESRPRIADPRELVAEGRVQSRPLIATTQDILASDLLNRLLDVDVPIVDSKRQSLYEARRDDDTDRQRIRGFLVQVGIPTRSAGEVRGKRVVEIWTNQRVRSTVSSPSCRRCRVRRGQCIDRRLVAWIDVEIERRACLGAEKLENVRRSDRPRIRAAETDIFYRRPVDTAGIAVGLADFQIIVRQTV